MSCIGGAQDGLYDRIQDFVLDGVTNGLSKDNLTEFEKLLLENDDACRLYCKCVAESDIMQVVMDMISVEDSLSHDGSSLKPRGAVSYISGILSTALHDTLDYIPLNGLMAYLLATLIVGVGVAIMAVVPVSQARKVALHSPSAIERQQQPLVPKKEIVGRITGMVDCKWVDDSTVAINGEHVSLGRRYVLSSGLMKITYDTGAKVILQGPTEYEVESNNGGFLSIGKLTGKVEVERAKGFSIRTPTATITDLGTEFGVEVDREGLTTSHVFRGSIRVQAIATDGSSQGAARLLKENESVQVYGGAERKIVPVRTGKATRFIRELHKRTTKILDLVDVVAGGDGFSGRRSQGIDPLTGQIVKPSSANIKWGTFAGDGQYHRVEAQPLIDGVFVPGSRYDPVQINSAGDTFDGFSNSTTMTTGYFWAGGKGVLPGDPELPCNNVPELRRQTELDGVDYASPGHCMLIMHANKGITFDLEAIRRANPGYNVARFLAVAGNTETASEKNQAVWADLCVLVDNRMCFKLRNVNRRNCAMPVNIPITAHDSFLTLVTTDGENGIDWDCTIFGDPRLELVPAKTTDPSAHNHSTVQ